MTNEEKLEIIAKLAKAIRVMTPGSHYPQMDRMAETIDILASSDDGAIEAHKKKLERDIVEAEHMLLKP